jgi:hypothetical protein
MIEKKATVFEFAKDRLAPINAVFLFSTGVVGALDLLAPHGPYLSNLGIFMAIPMVLVMFAEWFAPEFVSAWLAKPAAGWRRAVKTKWERQRPLWMSAQFRLMMMIVVIVIILGQISKAKAETGGFLATNFSSFAYVQSHILDIKTDLKEIKDQLKNVKQEISADPRKELVNLGVKWQENDFEDAVKKTDLKILKLFMETDFVPNETYAGSAVYYALEKGNEQVINYLVQMKLKSEFASGGGYGSGCFGLLYGFDAIGPGLKIENGRKLLKNVCGGKKEKKFLMDKLNHLESEINVHKITQQNLRTDDQKNKFIHEKLNRCLTDDETKMLATITGNREKYCNDYARRQFESEISMPSQKDMDTLLDYKEFLKIIIQ